MKYAACLVAVMLALLVIGRVSAQLSFRKHRNFSRDEFGRAFADEEVPPEICDVVFDYYKSGVVWKDFGVAPDDTYDDDLSEGVEEIEDDARTLLARVGLKLREGAAPSYEGRSVRTVREMVLWLDAERKRQDESRYSGR